MSETWVIRNDAPLDPYEIVATNISFESNGQNFVCIDTRNIAQVSADIPPTVRRSQALRYYTSTDKYIEVTSLTATTQDDVPTGNAWVFTNEGYRTITFETTPTGNLLTWLQANADTKTSDMKGMEYEDIHLDDKSRWNQFQKKWNEQNYQSALSIALYSVFLNKRLDATSINDITSELLNLQKQGDASFKVDKIVVSTEPPTDLADGKVYFKMLGPVDDYSIKNAYYIEVHQKATGAGNYNKFNLSAQADATVLTEGTANKFGIRGVEYTLDKAIADVVQVLKQINTTQ